MFEFAGGKRCAHGGRGGAFAGNFDRGQELGVETELLAGAL